MSNVSPSVSGQTNEGADGSPIVEIRDVSKTYIRGKEQLDVLRRLNLTIKPGAFEALMGPSGSGKSTLLNLIAGLDSPSAGTVRVAGADLGSMGENARAKWRARNIGFIFQT